MQTYVALLRGINVGGKNKIPMANLRECLEELGFSSVSTYIASGNVILRSDKQPDAIATLIEAALPSSFALSEEGVRVLVLSLAQLRSVVESKPDGFGEQPDRFHSDAIFLFEDLSTANAMKVFDPRTGVDTIWPGDGVIYSQRLSAERTKSRLGKIVGTSAYESMTIRNWNTTTKLLVLTAQIETGT